jgi:hypothetical protein
VGSLYFSCSLHALAEATLLHTLARPASPAVAAAAAVREDATCRHSAPVRVLQQPLRVLQHTCGHDSLKKL